MSEEKKSGIRRGEMGFIVAIILGFALGILIKKVRIGLLIGLVLGVLIGLGSILRVTRTRK